MTGEENSSDGGLGVVTQRAYTLRLRGIDRNDNAWRGHLWATHEAINKGARVFGEWLLTLRGGLGHELADVKVTGKKIKGKKGEDAPSEPDRDPTADERRDRRVLLALSWLSVEDERGAPKTPGLIVAFGDDCKTARDSQDGRDRKVVDALRSILEMRGLAPATIDQWMADCDGSIKARIRDDAVWVNRSAAFDALAASWNGLTRGNSRAVLEEFFGAATEWIALPAPVGDGEDLAGDSGIVASSGSDDAKEFKQVARSFLSTNFGTGTKNDKCAISEALTRAGASLRGLSVDSTGAAALSRLCVEFGVSGVDDDARFKALKEHIGWRSGRMSSGALALATAFAKARLARQDIDILIGKIDDEAIKQRKGSAKSRPPWIDAVRSMIECAIGFGYVTERDLTGEFGVMLDHAARRVSIACSWIKIAELERRQFELDAMKLDQVRAQHPAAVAFLDSLGSKRGDESGAAGGASIVIRKRAMLGWKEVVAAWSRPECESVQDRIDASRRLQGELEKFGDGKLFESLAGEEAQQVWQGDAGKSDPTILERYSAGTVAEANQKRFKVPAYRHPDALRHPVFGDFGVSRWEIDFALHQSVQARSLGRRVGAQDQVWHADPRNMRMGLWTGARVEKFPLRWSSKRLAADLALADAMAPTSEVVTRADRLGRASVARTSSVHIASVFSEKEWNGRLQAPRGELDKVAKLFDGGKDAQAIKLRNRISWLVSFSPRLAPSGPFIKYAARNGIAPNKKSGEYWPNSAINKERKGHHAKLTYARLPGLRILSVDLGHRFAAACAVWESMSSIQVQTAATQGNIVRGSVDANALFAHIEIAGRDGRPRRTVFRRIGADLLPDGSTHPAPWATLERQFLIKLQGEDHPPRLPAPDEITMVDEWTKALGLRQVEHASSSKRKDVAELMALAVRELTRAARRHFDRARIAHNLTAQQRTRPGGISEPLTEGSRIDLLTDTLALWHGLFAGERWADPAAQNAWHECGLPNVSLPAGGRDDEGSFGGAGRKASMDAYRAVLEPHAKRLATSDLSKLSKRWADRWTQDDRRWAAKDGLLRSLRGWITPRGLRLLEKDSDATRSRKAAAVLRARHVGGMSMQRINTFTGLYQLLKAFKNRPEPDNLRKNIPTTGDDRLRGFNQRLLDVRDRLREQRVKQLASRITEAALGIGRIKSASLIAGAARPTCCVDAPCHAVVIESLTNYTRDELQTRRENRQLMAWSSAKVEKYLSESCQLHGLHLRSVQPNYTSRQCSRTAAPGLRGVEVSADELLTTAWWKRDVVKAKGRIEKATNGGNAGACVDLLLASAERWALAIPECDRQDRKRDAFHPPFHRARIILPRRGGDLFISESSALNPNGKIPALQADLNAAANIGLRALLDPDWSGKWWWVPCTGGTFAPSPEKTGGAIALKDLVELPHASTSSGSGVDPTHAKTGRSAAAKAKKEKEIENRWRDCAGDSLATGQWKSSAAYWSIVESSICERLAGQMR